MPVIGLFYTLPEIPEISYNPGDDLVRDGQRYLLERVLGQEPVTWKIFCGRRPGGWLQGVPDWVRNAHPKALWPYWIRMPVDERNQLPTCDYLINCSGPLMYSGSRFHSRFEPWSMALLRTLEKCDRPRFLNFAFGSLFQDGAWWDRLPTTRWATRSFVRRMVRACTLLTCRDNLASRLVQAEGGTGEVILCPSLQARHYHRVEPVSSGEIVVNFHPSGTRSRNASRKAEALHWVGEFKRLLQKWKAEGRPYRFVFHEDLDRQHAAEYWDLDEEPWVQPRSLPEFLAVYGGAEATLNSRIHGAYAAASFGVPSVVITSDSRSGMIDLLGLPHLSSQEASADRMHESILTCLTQKNETRERLLQLADSSRARYMELLEPLLHSHAQSH